MRWLPLLLIPALALAAPKDGGTGDGGVACVSATVDPKSLALTYLHAIYPTGPSDAGPAVQACGSLVLLQCDGGSGLVLPVCSTFQCDGTCSSLSSMALQAIRTSAGL